MKVEDRRKASFGVPVREIIVAATPHIDPGLCAGIRQIVLLDNDYHGSRNAAARYVPVAGTNRSDVEMYCSFFTTVPDSIKNNKIGWAFAVLSILLHELYHHRVRFQKLADQPSFDMEQRRADNWGMKQSFEVIKRMYPRENHAEEYNQLVKLVKEYALGEPNQAL